MTNIYDLIADLYTDDESWNQVLHREYADEFLRREAFAGADDDELIDIWSQVMFLLVYCGNSGANIGDLSGEDFIYCLGWCQRNVGDFILNYRGVERFLSVNDRLLRFLKQKKAISDDTAAAKCRVKVLGEGEQLLIFNKDGSLPSAFLDRRLNSEPDLPMKVFVQLGQRLTDIFGLLRDHFQHPLFQHDRERAYLSFFGTEMVPDLEEHPDLFATFWEYFTFDYHLISNNQRPLEEFYEFYKKNPRPEYGENNHSLLSLMEMLLQAELLIFTVEEPVSEGWYQCRDFFTGNLMELCLPLDEGLDYTDFLCSAHVFEDGNLVTEYLRSVTIPPLARKALRNNFTQLLKWYQVAAPQADWAEFCRANGALVLHVIAYAGVKDTVLEAFRWTTNVRDYRPAVAKPQDEIHDFLVVLYRHLHLPYRDCRNLDRMWNDFHAVSPVVCFKEEDFTYWCIALLGAYMESNDTPFFDMDQYVTSSRYDRNKIQEKIEYIRASLQLEPFDPRYVNEEAMISMILL